MRRWLFALLLLANLGLVAFDRLPAKSGISFGAIDASYSYGQEAIFTATVTPANQVKALYLFIQPEGMSVRVEQVELTKDGAVKFTLDLKNSPLRPFAVTRYWFRAALADGQEQVSPTGQFRYDDNRFQWQTLQDSQFQVFWYGRDLPFGQEVLNVAQAGLEAGRKVIPVELPAALRIYVYSNANDFQAALQIAGQSWMVGHASPEVGTILVSIPSGPEEKLELQRQVPHEITHVLQYALAGAAYTRVPNWLLEGTASLAELSPNPDYPSVLNGALVTETLLPINQLCGAFPREASSAFLAYAESASFARYLLNNYGASGISSLFRQYQDGVGCQEGTRRAFDASLDELDYRWRQENLGVDVVGLALRKLSPYLALLALLVLVPLVTALLFQRRQKESHS